MEPILHRQPTARKKNSTKVNVTISIIFHGLLFVAGAYWAAHEGMLGKKMQNLSASILAKEKKPEVKKEEPKQEEVKKVETAKVVAEAKNTPPPPPAFVPPAAAGEAAAPPPVILGAGDFAFSQSDLTDPVIHYKQQVETALREKWQRPVDAADLYYVAEVEVSIDPTGKVLGTDWKKGSGDAKWDESVRRAVASTKAFVRPPPKGFPEKVLVRFDVQEDRLAVVQ